MKVVKCARKLGIHANRGKSSASAATRGLLTAIAPRARAAAGLLALSAMASAWSPGLRAQTQPPVANLPAVRVTQGTLVDPSALTGYYSSTQRTTSVPGLSTPVEIVELANGLGAHQVSSDIYAQRVFDYVYANIRPTFMFGLQEGALGALLNQSGTDFDQADLMVALLGQGNITAQYVIGTITLDATRFAAWTGVSDSVVACRLLAEGGIPAKINGSTQSNCSYSGPIQSVELAHLWVTANVAGSTMLYDPSVKKTLFTAPIDLPSAMQCGNQSSPTCAAGVLAQVPAPTTIGGAVAVQGNYRTNIEGVVSGYAKNLQHSLQTNYPGASLEAIIGGSHTDLSSIPAQTGTLPYPSSTATPLPWAAIPDVYRSKLRVQFQNIDMTLFADEIAGKRLRILGYVDKDNPDGTSGPLKVDLYLEYQILQTSSTSTTTNAPSTSSVSNPVTLTVDHPYAASGGNYMDEQLVFGTWSVVPDVNGLGQVNQAFGFNGFTILNSWGPTGQGAVEHLAALQQKNLYVLDVQDPTNAAHTWNNCWPFSYASLTPLDVDEGTGGGYQPGCLRLEQPTYGWSWLAQNSRALQLVGQVNNSTVLEHHQIGFVISGNNGLSQDTTVSADSGLSIVSLANAAADRQAASFSAAVLSARLEGSISEQQQEAFDGFSSPNTFARANQQGIAFLQADSSNISSLFSSGTLVNYPQTVQNRLTQSLLASGFQAILPQRWNLGTLQLPSPLSITLPFGAYLAYLPAGDQIVYAVSDDLKGASPVADVDDPAGAALNSVKQSDNSLKSRKYYGVDLARGALTLTPPPDLVIGAGDAPVSLAFQRTYSSGEQALPSRTVKPGTKRNSENRVPVSGSSLGDGWEHNWDIRADMGSDAMQAMGQDSALDAASAIATVFVLRDLNLAANRTIQTHLASIFTANWWGWTLFNNAVTVQFPPVREQYIRLPDGRFNPPPNSANVLTQTNAIRDPYRQDLNVDYSPITLDLTKKDGSMLHFEQGATTINPDGSKGNMDGLFKIFYPTLWQYPTGLNIYFDYYDGAITNGTLIPQRRCLQGIRNNVGHHLTFTLAANRLSDYCTITAVADETGRSIGYTSSQQNAPPAVHPLDHTFVVTNPDGGLIQYHYHSTIGTHGVSRATEVIDHIYTPGDQTNPFASINYDSLWRVSSVTDALNNVTAYSVGEIGNEVLHRSYSIDPLLKLTTSFFDFFDQKLQTIDPLGRVTSWQYDNAQELLRQTFPEGNSTEYSYDLRHNILTTKENPKPGSSLPPVVTTVTYVEPPGSPVCVVNQNTCNKPSTADGPRIDAVDVTAYSYNSDGTLARILGPTVNWQDSGSATGTGGAQVDLCYSPYTGTDGAPISLLTGRVDKTGASTRARSYQYSGVNGLTLQSATTDPAVQVPVAPSVAGNPCQITTNASATPLITTFGYDVVGNVTSIDGPLAGSADTTNFNFDTMRRLTRVQAPLVQVNQGGARSSARPITRYTFDLDGQLRSTRHSIVAGPTDSNPSNAQPTDLVASDWQTESRAYWPTGDLQSVTDPELHSTQYVYDQDGRQTLVTDADGKRVSTVYDAAGQVLCIWRGWNSPIPANTCAWDSATYAGVGPIRYGAYTYSNNGKQLTVTDANNNTTRYGYDYLDRLQYTAFPDPNGSGTCTLPSSEGASIICAAGQTYERSGFDSAGNRTSFLTRQGDSLGFAFDAANRLSAKVVPGLPTVSYSYNLLGQAMLVSSPSLGSQPAHSTSYDYDKAGRRLFEQNDGNKVSYQYDNAGNRTQTTWPDNYYVSYKYDVLNRLQYVYENSNSANELAFYDYDILSRRAVVCLGGHSADCIAGAGSNKAVYNYEIDNDLAGLTHTLNASSLAFTYGHSPAHRMSAFSASDSFYLPTPPIPATTYVPNSLNQYAKIAGVDAFYYLNGNLKSWAVPGAGSSESYTYDAENRLRTATVTGVGATSATYDYDALGRRVSKTVAGVTTNYLLDGDEEIAEYAGSTLLRRYITSQVIDDRIAHVEGSTKAFYHVNHQGSVVDMTDAAGNATQSMAYDEYGNPPQPVPGGEQFRFTGRRLDPETGLYYYRARYYAPQLGRFLQSDPAGYDDDLNLYSYVYNDPLDKTDPTGRIGEAEAIGCAVTVEIGCVPGVIVGGLIDAGVFGGGLWLLHEIAGSEDKPPHIEVDETGKVHGKPLPKAGDVRNEDLDDAIDALDESIRNREKEQERERANGQNVSPDKKERQKYRSHQDRITEERKLKEDLERRRQQEQDKKQQEEQRKREERRQEREERRERGGSDGTISSYLDNG